jgi:segregation and condensation protein B
MNHLTRLIEAALFSADRPLVLAELRALEPGTSAQDVEEALDQLRGVYDTGEHGITLAQLGDGYQLLSRPEMAEALTRARITSRPRRLSVAALETLAVIAYRQPVGRSEIEEIRGVAADGVLRSLQERSLIDIAGRGEGLGRPLLYGTTPKFLELVGLKDIAELPRLDELAVALRPLAAPGADDLGLEELAGDADENERDDADETGERE